VEIGVDIVYMVTGKKESLSLSLSRIHWMPIIPAICIKP
jgi:hypothetical protein